MKVSTTTGSSFELRKTVCRDHRFQATRAAVKKSVETFRSLLIRQYGKENGQFVTSLFVPTDLTCGVLQLGCHRFNRVASKKILKWAGVKP